MSDENITVGSAHVDLGSSFREHAKQEIQAVAKKYLGNLTMASVHVTKEGNAYRCSVSMQPGGLNVMVAEAQAHDLLQAFKTALSQVEKQLRRTKRMLREDRQNRPDRIISA